MDLILFVDLSLDRIGGGNNNINACSLSTRK